MSRKGKTPFCRQIHTFTKSFSEHTPTATFAGFTGSTAQPSVSHCPKLARMGGWPHIFSVATAPPTRNPRRPARTGRALRRVLYAQQRKNVAHTFPDWRGRATDVRPSLVGGCQ